LCLDGILNIDKPHGKTSYSVVAAIKKSCGERRVGHAGTLDPDATGVLPVCVGQGTRVVEYLADASKTYLAEVELGIATDTYDASGTVTECHDPSNINREQFYSALANFRGSIEQVPPMYSALKHNGQKLYELARAGIEIERKSRTVTVHHLELIDWQPPVSTIIIECSKGTYIRSLAHDLGQLLNCGAHLKSLVRTVYGPFNIQDSVSISDIEDAFTQGCWQQFLHPLDSVLGHLKSVTVSNDTKARLRNGCLIDLEEADIHEPTENALPPCKSDYCRAYDTDGRLLAILHFITEAGTWHPHKVFPEKTGAV